MRSLKIILVVFLLISVDSFAQRHSHKRKYPNQKNSVYFYWGYNRSAYTKSDIHFTGPDYDFTLINAEAKDRPSNDIKTYFNPKTFTVPQFNFRIGWFYKENWDWSIGWDHMKYVMRDDQLLYINGDIDASPGFALNGSYTNGDGKIRIAGEDLHYENTDGLNYVTVQLNHSATLYRTNDRKFAFMRVLGLGAGPVITQTGFLWDGTDHQSEQKFGGYGISAHTSLRFDFFNRFFLRNNLSGGFIHLPKNATVQRQNHYASHKFMFAQWEIVAGVFFYLRNTNGCDSCPDWK
jgi:hypothetical protein